MDSERLTFPQRRADALVMMAEHYLCSAATDGVSLSSLKGFERCQLVVHVHQAALTPVEGTEKSTVKGTENTIQPDANLDGRWIDQNAALRLACDASVLLVEQDDVGNVLDIGRRSRTIPAAMARALSIRDGGCQFPGCSESRYVEGHHIKHWAQGGETKLDNLVTLCRFHHRELHREKFSLSVKPADNNSDGCKHENAKPMHFSDRLCFSVADKGSVNKEGQMIERNPAKWGPACSDDSSDGDSSDGEMLSTALSKAIYDDIDEKTAVTKWLGERMDLGMAVDGLLWASRRA